MPFIIIRVYIGGVRDKGNIRFRVSTGVAESFISRGCL
jgi:hypothetical protein